MRYLKFFEKEIDAFEHIQLKDLAKTLLRHDRAELEFSPVSSYDYRTATVTVSRFWDAYGEQVKEYGRKGDVYLRCLGSAVHTDPAAVRDMLDAMEQSRYPRFGRQLFAMLEELRLESACIETRPGTLHAITVRRGTCREYYRGRCSFHRGRSDTADALLTGVYVLLTSPGAEPDWPVLPSLQLERVKELKPAFDRLELLRSTKDTGELALGLLDMLEDQLEADMRSDYFSILPWQGNPDLAEKDEGEFARLVTAKKLRSEDEAPDRTMEKKTDPAEKMPTWHRETKHNGKPLFRFEAERGTKTAGFGGAARRSEESDQALAIVQGVSGYSKRNVTRPVTDQADERPPGYTAGPDEHEALYRAVFPIVQACDVPAAAELTEAYGECKRAILALKRKLVRTLRETMELKRSGSSQGLHAGRLQRKLLPLVLDPMPRVFYKKSQQARELDAVFLLLVDCSASMEGKMDAVKRGLSLFRETLAELRVPHAIVGYWENTEQAADNHIPNVFEIVTDFQHSFDERRSAAIMNMQAHQDNRDGYAIRFFTKRMLARTEKQKVLLMFTDGEPSAPGYYEEGIADTHEAVRWARKQGVEIISLFLTDEQVTQRENRTMHHIYGRSGLVLSSLDELPSRLLPILRKLLLRIL